jgi:hypothetical protein
MSVAIDIMTREIKSYLALRSVAETAREIVPVASGHAAGLATVDIADPVNGMTVVRGALLAPSAAMAKPRQS